MKDIKKMLDLINETTAGSTSSGSISGNGLGFASGGIGDKPQRRVKENNFGMWDNSQDQVSSESKKDKKHVKKSAVAESMQESSPLDRERAEQRAYDRERQEFKRDELEFELAGEEERMRAAETGPFYLRIDGKIWRKQGVPVKFAKRSRALQSGQTIKDRTPSKQVVITRSPTDDVAEGTDQTKEMQTEAALRPRAIDNHGNPISKAKPTPSVDFSNPSTGSTVQRPDGSRWEKTATGWRQTHPAKVQPRAMTEGKMKEIDIEHQDYKSMTSAQFKRQHGITKTEWYNKHKELLGKKDKNSKEKIGEGKTGPGLWANIHAKRERIKRGSGERMRKPGSKGAPTDKDFKTARGDVKEEEISEQDLFTLKYKPVDLIKNKKQDHEVPMALDDLQAIIKRAGEMISVIEKMPRNGQLPGWVQTKIGRANDSLIDASDHIIGSAQRGETMLEFTGNEQEFSATTAPADIDEPEKNVGVLVYGRLGKPDNVWARTVVVALMNELPQEYPSELSAQKKVAEIPQHGGAIVTEKPLNIAKILVQELQGYGIKARIVDNNLEETYHGDEFYEAYGIMSYDEDVLLEAEYRGRKVTLNKPMRGDVKKFKVFVRDPKTGNVKKVNFGDPNMRIKKSNPARRKSFRARHNCDNPGPKTKARYWSCRKW